MLIKLSRDSEYRYIGIDRLPQPTKEGKQMTHCPLCEGHGRYNEYEDPLFNEPRFLPVLCPQCELVGYVEVGGPDEICVHKWKYDADPKDADNSEDFVIVKRCSLCGHERIRYPRE